MTQLLVPKSPYVWKKLGGGGGGCVSEQALLKSKKHVTLIGLNVFLSFIFFEYTCKMFNGNCV